MGNMTGSASAEINAPLDKVWEIVADVEIAPQWQGGLEKMEAKDRDSQGHATRAEATTDVKVRTVKSIIRFDYSAAPRQLSWTQEKGELKSVNGSWKLEDLGDNRTKATYSIDVDFGRILGALVRGPAEAAIRALMVTPRADELKQRIEAA